jgi:hypothetical protein
MKETFQGNVSTPAWQWRPAWARNYALMTYKPAGKNPGELELASPRAGSDQFKPVPGGRKCAS